VGRVVDGVTGAPLRRAMVSAYGGNGQDEHGQYQQHATLTDASGAFVITDLPAGRYGVSASKNDYYAVEAGKDGVAPPAPVDLSPGARARVTLSLARGGVVAGRIVDESGEPVSRVRVLALKFPEGRSRGQFQPVSEAQTDDLGHYRLFGLMPGEYLVQAVPDTSMFGEVTPAAQSGVVPTYYPGTPSRAEAQRIRVRAGSEVTTAHIALATARLREISGTVTSSRGQSVTRGFVMVSEEADGFSGTRAGGPIQDDGRFKVQPLPPGPYTLTVITGAPDDPETEAAFVPVTLAEADLEDVSIITVPPATVTGRIVFDPAPDDSAIVPPRFPLIFQAVSGTAANGPFSASGARPADDGGFELRLHGEGRADPGPADQWPRGWMIDNVLVGGVDATHSGVEFHAGEPVRDVQVVLTNRGAALSGTITDRGGAAVPGASVVVIADQGPNGSRSAEPVGGVADEQGRFTVGPIRSGAYVVAAFKAVRSIEPEDLDRLKSGGVSVQLARGEKKVLNLRLTPD